MAFTGGHPKLGGRQAGTPNKLTGAFREAVQIVYDDIGGHDAFSAWAKENPTDFYKIAARLIPVEIKDSSDDKVIVIVDRGKPLQITSPRALEDRRTQDDNNGRRGRVLMMTLERSAPNQRQRKTPEQRR